MLYETDSILPTEAYPSEVVESIEGVSRDEIESVLEELNDNYVFTRFRAAVQGEGTFFDPDVDLIDDACTTETVLNTYREGLQEADLAELKFFGLWTNEEREYMIKALDPGSITRRILLRYWGVKEDIPWEMTSNNICNKQSYKIEGFPNWQEVSGISNI